MRIESPGGRALEVGGGPTRLMGVLNVTPDSFSDGGLFDTTEAAVRQGLELVEAGADVLDLGGESTRPGYQPVPPEVQLERILPVLEALRPRVPGPISVDTTRATVAAAALDAGADWINDTSALREDPEMADVVASQGCPVVLMHRFDPPRTERDPAPSRRTVVGAIAGSLAERMAHAVRAGIDESRILLDPGLGFGTLGADNLVIHAHIDDLHRLGRPLVVGPSRKSFLGHVTGRPAHERLAGTAASVAALAMRGVAIVRVHDVAAMRDVVTVIDAIRRAVDSEDS